MEDLEFCKLKAIRLISCEHFGVSPLEFISQRREKRLVQCKFASFYLARKLTTHSLPAIGKEFGSHHTTVLYGTRRASELINKDDGFKQSVNEIFDQLNFQKDDPNRFSLST